LTITITPLFTIVHHCSPLFTFVTIVTIVTVIIVV